MGRETEIYRKNNKERELAIIKVHDQNKIIKKSGKKIKMKKTKEKEKFRKISRKGRQRIERQKMQEKKQQDNNNNNNKTHIREKIERRVRGI